MGTHQIKASIQEAIEVRQKMLGNDEFLARIAEMASAMVEIYKDGGKLLIVGNGGSAADAQHFAAEIVCQYKVQRQGRPAIALHTDTSAMTAWGNDVSFADFFARGVEAHGRKGDGLVLITTSGNSENLLRAARVARENGIRTFGLLGRDGGALHRESLCDVEVIIPSSDTPRIQECHIMVIHMLCAVLDQFFEEDDKCVS
jgi:D-sedoheptulose 7-phosphate isomerase